MLNFICRTPAIICGIYYRGRGIFLHLRHHNGRELVIYSFSLQCFGEEIDLEIPFFRRSDTLGGHFSPLPSFLYPAEDCPRRSGCLNFD